MKKEETLNVTLERLEERLHETLEPFLTKDPQMMEPQGWMVQMLLVLLLRRMSSSPGSMMAPSESTERAAPFVDQLYLTDLLGVGGAYKGPPRIPPDDEEEWRFNHIREEYRELINGRSQVNREKVFDAIIDLVAVLMNYCMIHGWNFDEGWKRVFFANSTKRKATQHDVDSGRARHITDWVKPPEFEPPTLSDLVDPVLEPTIIVNEDDSTNTIKKRKSKKSKSRRD